MAIDVMYFRKIEKKNIEEAIKQFKEKTGTDCLFIDENKGKNLELPNLELLYSTDEDFNSHSEFWTILGEVERAREYTKEELEPLTEEDLKDIADFIGLETAYISSKAELIDKIIFSTLNINNLKEDSVIYEHEDNIIKAGETTCWNCGDKSSCNYSFDPYNTDGDCLAIK